MLAVLMAMLLASVEFRRQARALATRLAAGKAGQRGGAMAAAWRIPAGGGVLLAMVALGSDGVHFALQRAGVFTLPGSTSGRSRWSRLRA